MPLAKYEEKFTRLSSFPSPSDQLRGFLAELAAKELEALAGAGKLNDAREVLRKLLQYDHSEATRSQIRTHLERAGHLELITK